MSFAAVSFVSFAVTLPTVLIVGEEKNLERWNHLTTMTMKKTALKLTPLLRRCHTQHREKHVGIGWTRIEAQEAKRIRGYLSVGWIFELSTVNCQHSLLYQLDVLILLKSQLAWSHLFAFLSLSLYHSLSWTLSGRLALRCYSVVCRHYTRRIDKWVNAWLQFDRHFSFRIAINSNASRLECRHVEPI